MNKKNLHGEVAQMGYLCFLCYLCLRVRTPTRIPFHEAVVHEPTRLVQDAQRVIQEWTMTQGRAAALYSKSRSAKDRWRDTGKNERRVSTLAKEINTLATRDLTCHGMSDAAAEGFDSTQKAQRKMALAFLQATREDAVLSCTHAANARLGALRGAQEKRNAEARNTILERARELASMGNKSSALDLALGKNSTLKQNVPRKLFWRHQIAVASEDMHNK